MKEINIYIAKRGREGHLLDCLNYLNVANKSKKYKVNVVIGFDDSFKLELLNSFPNLSIQAIYVQNGELFNKAKILNTCIEWGNSKNYDWFSVVDLDMLYPPNFFELIENLVEKGADWIVSHGWKLEIPIPYPLSITYIPFNELLTLPKKHFRVGPSQITVTKSCWEIVQKYFPGKLYPEEFLGWGGEDSIPSSISRKLYLNDKIAKVELMDVWLHQWHPEPDKNHSHYKKNQKLYFELNREIMEANLNG